VAVLIDNYDKVFPTFSACLTKMKQYDADQRAKREAERVKSK